MKLNAGKSKFIIFSRLQEGHTENYKIALFDDVISPCSDTRFLGIDFDQRLSFNKHIDNICTRANQRINVLRALARSGVSAPVVMKLYKVYILPLMEYGSSSFISTSTSNISKLQKVQNEANRISLRLPRYISTNLLHEYAGIGKVMDRLLDKNKLLLEKMSMQNKHVRELIEEHHLHTDVLPKSPFDLLIIK